MAARLDYLVTLTYRYDTPVLDRDMVQRHVQAFSRATRKALGGFLHVWVTEEHKSGSLHPHVAVRGWQKVIMLRHIWRKVIAADGYQGNIDVQAPRRGKRARWKSPALGNYLAKYLVKGGQASGRDYGEHRFGASLHIEVPQEDVLLPDEMTTADVVAFLCHRQGTRCRVIEGEGFAWCWSW